MLVLKCSHPPFFLSRFKLRTVLRLRSLKSLPLLRPIRQRSMLLIHTLQLPLQLLHILLLAQQRIQHDKIRNRVRVVGVNSDGLLQGGFGFWQAPEVQFGDGLGDEGVWGLGLGGLGELFENVECGLVFFAALGSRMLAWNRRGVGEVVSPRACRPMTLRC